MKLGTATFIFAMLFSNLLVGQPQVSDSVKEQREALFDSVQAAIAIRTAVYIDSINEEKLSKKKKITEQLELFEDYLPDPYHCLVKAKYPETRIDAQSRGVSKNTQGGIFVTGKSIDSDSLSLIDLIDNIIKYLEDYSDAEDLKQFKSELENIVVQSVKIITDETKEEAEAAVNNQNAPDAATADSEDIGADSEEGKDTYFDFLGYLVIALLSVAVVLLSISKLKDQNRLKEREKPNKKYIEEKSKLEDSQKMEKDTSLEGNNMNEAKKEETVLPVTPLELTTNLKEDWTIVGASVIGKSHIEMDKPCQDSHAYMMLNDAWGIAVTSDGAGSAKHSDIGSKAVVKMVTEIVFKKIVEENKWHISNKLPSQSEWEVIAKNGMLEVYAALEKFAMKKEYEFRDLACTVIVNIFSPIGLLVSHIGDGRAGYKSASGEWKASIVPHSGEESNQTIFITSAAWVAKDGFEMSGVPVPESRVIDENICAFTLMSDGGEAHLFESSKMDPTTNKWSDPNKPAALFDKHIETILGSRNSDISLEEISQMWKNYITRGNSRIANEPDDKTVILGILS